MSGKPCIWTYNYEYRMAFTCQQVDEQWTTARHFWPHSLMWYTCLGVVQRTPFVLDDMGFLCDLIPCDTRGCAANTIRARRYGFVVTSFLDAITPAWRCAANAIYLLDDVIIFWPHLSMMIPVPHRYDTPGCEAKAISVRRRDYFLTPFLL